MGFRRHGVKQFSVIHQRHGGHRRADPGERAVVAARAPAEPHTALVHGERRHDDQVRARDRIDTAWRLSRLGQAIPPVRAGPDRP